MRLLKIKLIAMRLTIINTPHGQKEGMNRSHTPRFSVLERRAANFKTSHGDFLKAAQHAAPQLVDVTGRQWYLDGFKGDTLYLRLDCDPSVPGLPAYLTAEFDLAVTPQTITVSVLTRSESLISLFTAFTTALNEILSKGDQ